MNKNLLYKNTLSVFETKEGKRLFDTVMNTIGEFGIENKLRGGVLIGFSGGADSVMLSLVLKRLAENIEFPIAALHVNHMIRGNEALRDEEFSKSFCEGLGIPFTSVRVDVPAIAKAKKQGIEEAAREVRYSAFREYLNENANYKVIATAHNATDNAETLLFNIFRGSGALGACGIAPLRDNVVRPLIAIPKSEILAFLDENGISYVTDSTNSCNDYSRNYIRNEILPRIKSLNLKPEAAATKFTGILREDISFIECIADDFIAKNKTEGKLNLSELSRQHDALISAVLRRMALDFGTDLEFTHVRKIRSLIKKGSEFSYDTPGGASFVCSGGYVFFKKKSTKEERLLNKFNLPLELGVNYIDEMDCAILVSYDKSDIISPNVYNFSIQAKLSFDIIKYGLYVRRKEDGDSYRYGGITRKLKKLFCDNKISKDTRENIPVICDNSGIVWVPGFGVRDNSSTESGMPTYITVYSNKRFLSNCIVQRKGKILNEV
jgi:tRNA(Ile)-lysidine synthase